MTWEIIFTLTVLLFSFISFLWEKISPDLTALFAFIVISLVSVLSNSPNLPSGPDFLTVFSNPAPITIACMFIISRALEKTGAIDYLAIFFKRLTGLGYVRFVFLFCIFIGVISAFINNTPVVVILLPVILTLAKDLKVPASKLLIPLSYASILGGCCTLIGTSTNILASGVVEEAGYDPIGMFELGKIGFLLLLVGAVYIALFGAKALPRRETLISILSPSERKEFITEAFIKPESELIGKSVPESMLGRTLNLRPVEVIRDGVALSFSHQDFVFEQGDRIVLACRPDAIAEARKIQGIDFIAEQGLNLEKISAQEGSIVEGVISPNASIIGKTIREINFRQRFRMVILAIHRQGKNLREKIETLTLSPGDTLLMLGTDKSIVNLQTSDEILLLDRPHLPMIDMRRKIPIVGLTILGIIASVFFDLLPIYLSTIFGVLIVFITRCLKPKEGYNAINWDLLVLIYGMLGLGMAMEHSGATIYLIEALVESVESSVSGDLRPYVMLAGLYFTTWLLTELLSNQATIVLMVPIALGLAVSLGVDPRPFIITTCIGASASFSSPIGFQTNTYVYSVGGYRFSDFMKFGIPLNLTIGIISCFLIPLLWSF